MELHDALDQIADIRLQMARTRVFRGYRSGTTLFSAGVAVLAAMIQSVWLDDPAGHIGAYLSLWLGAAAVCMFVAAGRLYAHYRSNDSSLQRELMALAMEQFTPSVVVGGLLTFVLARTAWSSLWILPGLWMILFGLGMLASRRILPGAMAVVGAFYLFCGLISIAWAQTHAPFSPWQMGLPFGVGQTAAAAVLYWKLERSDATR